MNNLERFNIYCPNCEDDRFLIPDTDSGSYRCPDCSSIYYDEDGVYDLLEAREFYATFRGAKLAGLIPEDDVPRDSWRGNDWTS